MRTSRFWSLMMIMDSMQSMYWILLWIDKLMDGLKVKLETAYKASGGRKVTIISHSMGGLLVMCFMSLHNEVFSKYVNKWVTIACPFQGAPGCINDALLTGLQFIEGFEAYFFVSRWTMHQLLVECPSVYEMLPNPYFSWKMQPQINVWRGHTEDGETSVKLESYSPIESISLFKEALRHNELDYGGNTIALPFNFSILNWAAGTRKLIDNAKLPIMVQKRHQLQTCQKYVIQCLNILMWTEMELFLQNPQWQMDLKQLRE
ncbi:hypothetical protein ES319_D08G272700v1 [Gossypium barbadense]|uniref:Uncharacterized protein n=1 Tax=Gossypium barbadense TaxID=3634 RepID=A0A5J5QIX1_GOSBA|nr:hypothetical protein ES319_D08G272700v1 [Gossypium barbadense]